MASSDSSPEIEKPFPDIMGYFEKPNKEDLEALRGRHTDASNVSDDDNGPKGLRTRYAEFVINHHQGLRRLGVATFIGGLPLGIVTGVALDVHPAVTSQVIMGVGVIEYSLGVAGRDIDARQQG